LSRAPKAVSDIFISHARADAEIARRFAEAFRADGFDVWWDNALQTGELFDQAIEDALRGAKAVVVLWSPESVVSRWVRAEATVADHNNTLLPVTIKPCRRPVIFELTQTADLSRWKGNRKDPAWRALGDDVRRMIGREADQGKATSDRRPSTGASAGWIGRLRSPIAAGVAVLALLVAGLLWWISTSETQAEPPLRIAAFDAEQGPEATQFAQDLRDHLVDTMGEAGIPTTTDDSAGTSTSVRPGMILGGSVIEAAGNLKVFAQLQDAKSGVSLWSQEFQGPAANSDALTNAIAIAAAEPLYELREIKLQKDLKVSADDLAPLMKTQQMINNPRVFDQGMLRQTYEAAIARAPNIAYEHANLAVTLVQDGARSPPDQRNALFAQARAEADTAFKISPAASGGGYDARYLISVYNQPGDIAGQEALLLDGLSHAPGFPYLSMRECQFLMSVGRNDDAWPYCQRAHAMRPLTAPIEWRFAQSLHMRGEDSFAEQAMEKAVHDYPQNGLVRLAKFEMLAFASEHEKAAALLPAMLNQGEGFGAPEIDALKLYLAARSSGRPSDSDRAAAAILSPSDSKLRVDLAVKALVTLGKIDQAFGLLEGLSHTLPPEMDLAPANPGTSFLFAPETAPLRADPRFWAVAKQQGLVRYWTSTGKWPDFCGKEQPLKQCQQAASKARTAIA
jgi:TolB-like protein